MTSFAIFYWTEMIMILSFACCISCGEDERSQHNVVNGKSLVGLSVIRDL